MAQDFKNYVENNKKVPFKLTYNHIEFYTPEMLDIMVWCLLNLDMGCTAGITNWCSYANGDNILENILKDDYMDQARRVHDYIIKNSQSPNFVTTQKSKKRVNIDLYAYTVAKILVFYHNHGQLPNYCAYNSSDLSAGSGAKTYSEQILEYFESKFGKVSTIDGALAKIRNCGYGYYYDDKLSNKQTIDGLATRGGTKPNCTDIHHVFWHIGKALGYEVRAVHIKCSGGDGHVRLDFKNSKYDWFSRDASAVADGECIECVWCRSGTILSYNPQWFLQNVNR